MQHNRFALIIVLSLFLNLGGSSLVTAMHLPVFFDSIGTMLSAILIGPWVGGMLGLMTNITRGIFHSTLSIPFGLVNMGVGIVSGYLMLLLKDYRRPLAPLVMGIVIAIAAPLMAAPVATYLFGGITAHGIDKFVISLMQSGHSLLSSTFWGRIPYSFVDKVISAYLVFLIIRLLPQIADKPSEGRVIN